VESHDDVVVEVTDAMTRPNELLTEARQALASFELDMADSLATSAHHLHGGWPADQVLAQVLVRRGRYEQAAAVLPEAPPGGAPVELRTRWAVTAAAIHYWGAGDVAAAERVLAEAGGVVAAAHRAGFVLLDGRPGAALAGGEKVLRDPRAPAEASIPAVATVVVAASVIGRFDRAAAAVEGVGPLAVAQVGYVHCFALLMAGRAREASRLAEDGYGDAVAAGNIAVAGGWSALRGLVAKARGDLAAAVAALSAATRLLEGHDSCRMLAPCLAELAMAQAMSGDQPAAEHTLCRAGLTDRLFAPWFKLSRAWATAAAGDTSLAVRQASAAADLAMTSGQFAVEAVARYDVARLGDPKAARRRLAELTAVVQGPLVPAMAAAASALARSDAGALDRATATFAGLGYELLAAETATAASVLHRRAGRAFRADQAAARAAEGPDAATPLLRLATALIGLTRRERDVALLAAAGLSSQTIGGRLRLSVRTVDNYLGRIYQKLGVVNRRDLCSLVGRRKP
jgi:DNA-binding CsgD family transcriptional regulator